MSRSEIGSSVEATDGDLGQLLEVVGQRIGALQDENRRLLERVAELCAEVEQLTLERRADSELTLAEWLTRVVEETGRRSDDVQRSPRSAADARRLRALSSVLELVTADARKGTVTDVTAPEIRAYSGAFAEVDVTPESLLAAPVAPVPEHRVVRHGTHGIQAPEAPRRHGHSSRPSDPARARTLGASARVRGAVPPRPRRVYEPTWMERRLPWVGALWASLDIDRYERGYTWVTRWLGDLIARLVEPLDRVVTWGSAASRRFRDAVARVVGRALAAGPLPATVRKWAWIAWPGEPVDGAAPLQTAMKARYRAVFWSSVIASVFVHMAVFAFWPTMHASDFTFAAEELTAVELPPEIEIPPPPQQVARPATPVIAAAALEEDVTIAPTTFEDNPVEELPPPPEIGNASDAAAGPSFTPFTVAPRILNGEEIAGVMRLEYPPLLRDAGIGGEVVVWFYIDERGQLQGTRLFQSSGHEELDEAALRVADRIRFSPALNGDRNVPVWIQFPLTFRVR